MSKQIKLQEHVRKAYTNLSQVAQEVLHQNLCVDARIQTALEELADAVDILNTLSEYNDPTYHVVATIDHNSEGYDNFYNLDAALNHIASLVDDEVSEDDIVLIEGKSLAFSIDRQTKVTLDRS